MVHPPDPFVFTHVTEQTMANISIVAKGVHRPGADLGISKAQYYSRGITRLEPFHLVNRAHVFLEIAINYLMKFILNYR